MKVREEQVRQVCRTILSRWKERGMIVPKAPEEALLAKMAGAMLEDFRREQELDREVEALMEKHSGEIARNPVNSRQLFLKIKERLAKERKIVL